MILAPPPRVGIAEHIALEVHARTVGGLGVLEGTEVTVVLRNCVLTLFHGLLLGGLDGLGGSGTLQHAAKFLLLGRDVFEEVDLGLDRVGTGDERAERVFLSGHRRRVAAFAFTSGSLFGFHSRLNLSGHVRQFVQQCLDLVHGDLS